MRRRLLLALAVAGAALACRQTEIAPAAGSYTVRGQVVSAAAGGGELTVHHEAIADFRDRQGKVSPMESMAMPFAVAPGVSLDGVTAGDKVEMTFEVRWQEGPPLLVVALRELDGATALDLGAPHLELVTPFGSGAATPTPAPTPAGRPATDGAVATPSETI